MNFCNSSYDEGVVVVVIVVVFLFVLSRLLYFSRHQETNGMCIYLHGHWRLDTHVIVFQNRKIKRHTKSYECVYYAFAYGYQVE